MRVLVTGASGFIGGHVVRAVQEQGWDIRTLHRGGPIPGVTDHAFANITLDPLGSALSDIDAVIHLAGQGDVAASAKDPLGYNLVNAVGTLRVLEASRLVGARVIFASTQHVYRPSRGRLSERQSPNPQNVYGTSKLIAERWCEMYGATYGMSVAALRLYSVYGPGQVGQGASGVVSIFAQAAMNNRTISVMSDQRRDFTHVSDVARAVITTIEKEPRGFNLFNIATGVGTTFRQLATQLIRTTHSKSQIDDSGLVPAQGHLVPTIDRAASELGFTTQIPLAEGLKDYFERLRDTAVRSA